MYYISAQEQQHHQSELQPLQIYEAKPNLKSSGRRSIIKIAVALASLVIVASASVAISLLQSPPPSTQADVKATPSPTPSTSPQVAGASFSQMLNQSQAYQGWIAGINQGAIELLNPQTGQLKSVTKADSPWHGPISDLYWSPGRTHIAAIYANPQDAQQLSANASAYMKSLGLDGQAHPQAFPYGQLIVIELASGQATSTGLEVKNGWRPVQWLDNDRLAVVSGTISVYSRSNGQTQSIIAAGSTDIQEQLHGPLAYNSTNATIYFLKKKQINDSAITILTSLSLTDATIRELMILDHDWTTSADMALSVDHTRLAVLTSQGAAYVDLATRAKIVLPKDSSRLWLEGTSLSAATWLSSGQLGFKVLYPDGSQSAAGWDISANTVQVYAKNHDAMTWNTAAAQVASLRRVDKKVSIIAPNWIDPNQSQVTELTSQWQSLYW